MKTGSSVSQFLGSFFVFSLSACIVASAFSFDSILRGLHQNVFTRSLPGSLAFTAPEAVGSYQPPPDPVVYGPLPATASDNPDSPATTPIPLTAGNTSDNDNGFSYGSKQALAATESREDTDDSPHNHIPSVSEMDATIAAQTGSAGKDAVASLASLVASIFVSLIHL